MRAKGALSCVVFTQRLIYPPQARPQNLESRQQQTKKAIEEEGQTEQRPVDAAPMAKICIVNAAACIALGGGYTQCTYT